MPDIDELALLAPLSLEELYAHADVKLNINQEELKRALAASVLFCQRYTKRNFVPEGTAEEPVTKLVTPAAATTRFRVPDVHTIVSLELDGEALALDACVLEQPDGYGLAGLPSPWARLTAGSGTVLAITGRFGFVDVPADVRDAIYSDAIRRANDKDAAFGDRVEAGDGTIVSYFRTMPARVQAVYKDLRIASDVMGVE